ncbi:MAG TPA: sulfotransferase family 2 domain-containing protein, partial [Polyangia bacterium]
ITDRLHAAGFSAHCLVPPDLCPLPGWEETPASEDGQLAPEMLIFHHVAKCAGTSFTALLRRYFGPNFIEVNSVADWRACERFVRERGHARRICAAGHDAFGIHELAQGRRVRYVTLLRHPWQRFVSAINFRVGFGAHVDRIEVPRNSLIAHFSPRRSLEEAKDILDQWFESVGVIERYDEVIRLFAHQLQLPARHEHNNKSRDWRTSRLNELRPRFDERNQDDIAFYEYARARFQRDLDAVPGLHKQLNDNPAPLEVLYQPEPDDFADEMKHARASGDPADLVKAHHAFFSRLPYGHVPSGIALEHSRLIREAGRPDLGVFWHHGALQPSVRALELALNLAALDPYTMAALSLHIELVKLGHLGKNPLALTIRPTRRLWQKQVQDLLLRAHLWRHLQDPTVLAAPALFARLDESFTEALREVATRLGLEDRLHIVDQNDKPAKLAKPPGSVLFVHGSAGPALFAGVRTIALPAVPEPDWPYFAEFSRPEAPTTAVGSAAPAAHHPSAQRA